MGRRTDKKQQHRPPYVGYVYSLYLFIRKLYDQCISDGVINLFFLSREGQFLKKLFDAYLNIRHDKSITTHYLYVSRASTFVASLASLDYESFDTLFRSYDALSLSKVMQNCGFTLNEVDAVKESLNLDVDRVIENVAESAEWKALKKNIVFASFYDRIRTEQRCNFLSYLESFSIDLETEGLHVVDVGWKGTIQDNLYRLLGSNVSITGYYLGLNEETDYNKVTIKKSILFTFFESGDYSPFCDVFLYDFDFFERLLFADHGSVLRYSKKEDCCEAPVLCSLEDDAESLRLIKPTQIEILSCFSKVCRFYSSEEIDLQITASIARIHLETVLRYRGEEKKLQKNMLKHHTENFGFLAFYQESSTDMAQLIRNVIRFDHRRRSFLFSSLLQLNIRFRDKVAVSLVLVFLITVYYHLYEKKQLRLLALSPKNDCKETSTHESILS